MKSPFDDLQIDPAEVCEFFAVFARFEYAMKATRYCGGDRYGNAMPDWRSLKADLGGPIGGMQIPATDEAMAYLLADPPQVQKVVDRRPVFQTVPLDGDTSGAKAIEAAKRVRNNLFHGGKHTPHSPPERDTRLLRAASVILDACLIADPALNAEFEHQLV